MVAALGAGLLLLMTMSPGLAADRDKDGLYDGFEKRWGVTNPGRKDSDRDGVIDAAEANDKDGLGNLGEQRFGTDPGRKDTDRDGINDAKEDKDRDGRSNGREQDQRPLPANLKPPLGSAKKSFPPIRFKCQTPNGRAKPVSCSFGSAGSPTRVVLTGDSHAMMWSSPIRRIAESNGWRLTVLTKTACSPVLGIHTPRQREIDGGVSCRAWRRNVIDRLRANPPELIVLTSSDSYTLARLNGAAVPRSKWPATWRKGLKRTLAAYPSRSHVLVLGDVPHNVLNPRECLVRNSHDMSACTSPRYHSLTHRIEQAWREAAKAKGATFRTLSGKICSYKPCPVVQGSVLIWRNQTHLTNQFALQLTPAMRAHLEDAVTRSAAGRR